MVTQLFNYKKNKKRVTYVQSYNKKILINYVTVAIIDHVSRPNIQEMQDTLYGLKQ